MSKHVHADAMAQYAQDAQVSDTPWEFWELRTTGPWEPLMANPAWVATAEYRRIRAWPTPFRTEAEVEAVGRYWTLDHPRGEDRVTEYTWDADEGDLRVLDKGLAFRSEADAAAALGIIANLVPGTRL